MWRILAFQRLQCIKSTASLFCNVRLKNYEVTLRKCVVS
uniref:Uncharacterized protein n=1 Tax=Rhizophora mucronata TaxID=61149 RepID=A0A2P2J801_RHIMU